MLRPQVPACFGFTIAITIVLLFGFTIAITIVLLFGFTIAITIVLLFGFNFNYKRYLTHLCPDSLFS